MSTSSHPTGPPQPGRSAAHLLVFAAALILANFAVVWPKAGVVGAIVWLPTGVAIAGLWRMGTRAVWLVFGCTIINRLLIDYDMDVAVVAAMGSAGEALLGVALLRLLRLDDGFARLRDVASLFVTAAVAPLASLLGSAASRSLSSQWTGGPIYEGWGSWWRMNALGAAVVVPMVLVFTSRNRRKAPPHAWLTLAALLAMAMAILWGVTMQLRPSPTSIVLLYTALPIPLLGALRLGPRGAIVLATACALFVATISAVDLGPFSCVPPDERLTTLQVFLLTLITVPLVLGSLIAERETEAAARKRLEDQLLQAQKMDAIGKLAGGVAHDFNNLLTAITGCAEAVCERLPANDANRGDIGGILHAADRASSLIRQLLAFSRQQVLRPSVLDLGLVVEMLAPMLRRLLGASVQLVTRSNDGPNRVRVDRVQMEQVLLNLALNARDAMVDGGTLTIAISHCDQAPHEHPTGQALPPGDYVCLSVTDTGCGMTPEVRERAQDPFFSTKDPSSSTGLGLSTVFGIVAQSGGVLHLDSAIGTGTQLRIYLPQVNAPSTTTAVAVPLPPTVEIPRPETAATTAQTTVLLAEDEEMVRALVTRLLRRAGYAVHATNSGPEALATLEQIGGAVDVLVTDMVMPGMGGRELANKVRGRVPSVRVLFMSGYAQDASELGAAMGPDQGFLQKPFGSEQMLQALQDLLAPAPTGARNDY